MVVEINKSALNIANDVYDSCRRRAQYDNANFNQFIEQRDALEQKCERPDGPKGSSEDLNSQVAVELLTDIKEPGKEIQTAIHNMSDAINKIEKVNQFFEKLAVAIDILQALVSAVGSGNPAKISVILNKLTV